jgi:hypothetical protein
MGSLEGEMSGTSGPGSILTRLQRVAELSRKRPGMVWTTLAHHIDLGLLKEAYRLTRKDGSPGVDGQTAQEYGENLEENLRTLLERLKSGTYQAPPVRRVYIPKGDGKKSRPIGIPAFEDKVLQRAVVMVPEAVHEQDFLDCSYGFRPGRSAHQALAALWQELMRVGGGFVIELDIGHREIFRYAGSKASEGISGQAGARWSHPTGDREMVKSRSAGGGGDPGTGEWNAPRGCDLGAIG